MALTSVNRDHHHATGFDQGNDLDRARPSKLMDRSAWKRTDILSQPSCHKARGHAKTKKCYVPACGKSRPACGLVSHKWRLVAQSGLAETSAQPRLALAIRKARALKERSASGKPSVVASGGWIGTYPVTR